MTLANVVMAQAEAFAASLADLTPVAERRGNYVHAPVVARTYVSDRALPVARALRELPDWSATLLRSAQLR